MPAPYSRRRFLALPALLAAGAARAQAPRPVLVAAASDLKFALDEILGAYAPAREIRVVYGSSGNFAHQIEAGAPFQIFLSADEAYVARLAARGLTEDGGRLYALGRIALFAATASPVQPDAELRDLAAALRDGRLKRFAIANPEHAPYGRAAREALINTGLWAAIAPRLVLGENASQAAQFAATGAVQAGIVPLSLAQAPELAARGRHALLAAQLHAPLRQRMVLLKGADAAARAFYAHLHGPAARAVLSRYGFSAPD